MKRSPSERLDKAVWDSLRTMKKIDILVFYLKIEKGLSNTEIAEITGVRPVNIRSSLRKTYDNIEERLTIC